MTQQTAPHPTIHPYQNVGFWPQHYAKTQPDVLAFKIPNFSTNSTPITYDHYTFDDFERMIVHAHNYFIKNNIQGKDRILLMIKMGPAFIANLFALFRIGAIPILIDPGLPFKKLISALKSSHPTHLIGEKPYTWIYRSLLKIPTLKSTLSAPNFKNLNLSPPLLTTDSPSGDAPLAIVFTSGSTGTPKGTIYTHTLCIAQLNLLKNHYNLIPGMVDHPLLLNFALFNPALGITTLLPPIYPNKPLKSPLGLLFKTLSEPTVTHSFGSPIFWKKITQKALLQNLTFPHIQKLFLAGCSTPPGLIKDLNITFPNAQIEIPYGATEALPLTTLDGHTLAHTHIHQPYAGACLGKPLPSIKIQIITPLNTPLPPMNIGEIAVSGPIVSHQYDHNATANNTHKYYNAHHTQWHKMGDIGYIDAHGFIWFLGRKQECCTTPIHLMYTEPCEALFLKHPIVKRAALIFHPKTAEPHMIVEPMHIPYAYLPWLKKKLIKALKHIAQQQSHTCRIQTFSIIAKLPVDVRHNAKIHRLQLQKKFYSHFS